ncbi:MAG: D-alanyl-D-alanine carboxypeptidase/D-alanyl-D-alanine-endopeptidase [Rhodocyclaceae bacterium]|nr:D-alanyl-D-alanine carboxypeptidase/D-alanyl-D-alanine-endopeptidase [Rhodocyclaceae bacterium]
MAASRRGLLAAFHVALALYTQGAGAALPAPVADELSKVRIPEEAVSVWVQQVGQPEPEVAHYPDRPMNPASVMKLVTSFVAFDVLGPTHTWKTRVLADAAPRDGILDGNLYIVGEGDPALTLERLWLLLRGIRQKGIDEIRGNLVLDRSAWRLPPFDPAAFDGRGTRPYNIGPDPLMVNFAALKLRFVPQPKGSPRLQPDPPLDGVSVVSALRSTRGGCGDWDERLDVAFVTPGSRPVIRVGGEWRDSCGEREWFVAPMAPADFSRLVVAGMWKELGGRLTGRVFDGETPGEARLISVEVSPTLSEVVRDMNKWSNNVQARHLLATLGASAGGLPNAVTAGAQVVEARLRAAGMDTTTLVVENGSGLSRIESISARTLGQMLDRAFAQPWMPEFISSLSVAGVDGTGRHRLSGSPARGFAHIKTGTINGARAVAGYVLDRDGRRHVVAMLVNDPSAWASRAAQDALLEWVWYGARRVGPAAQASGR